MESGYHTIQRYMTQYSMAPWYTFEKETVNYIALYLLQCKTMYHTIQYNTI